MMMRGKKCEEIKVEMWRSQLVNLSADASEMRLILLAVAYADGDFEVQASPIGRLDICWRLCSVPRVQQQCFVEIRLSIDEA